ncbi:MAG: hypothetical protein QOG56_2766 [Solirubrobacteraceae bacterium]|nr:hypothetical protein [Solirubrobacteraceae bacterium]
MTRVTRKIPLALATLSMALALAGSAHASGRTVIDDCTDDEIMARTYTQQEYRDALAKLPADADQYGNCRDIIARAQDAAATKGAAKGDGKGDKRKTGAAAPSSGGRPAAPAPSVAPAKQQLAAATPQERAAVRDAARDAPADEAATAVAAERVGSAPSSSGADLPLPILVLLGVLLAGALALGAVRVRSLVHTRRA